MTEQPEPDTKDWTWVLEQPCDDCGFDAGSLAKESLSGLVQETADRWRAVLRRSDVAERPGRTVWSPLEYACHVRDVHRIFGDRLRLLIGVQDPAFPNWDQDAAAIEGAYAQQEPIAVERELTAASAEVAGIYAGVTGDEWQRSGTRSNGSRFTVESLGRYHLHDVVHHLYDVRG